jgi:hypothetical protein
MLLFDLEKQSGQHPVILCKSQSKDSLLQVLALHNICRVRPYFTQEVAQVLIQALVISRLDYCNWLLAAFPAHAIKPLQFIQNTTA